MASRSTADATKAADRRRKVAALYLRGRHQYAIAEQLGVSQSTVSKDLSAIRKEWADEARADFGQKMAAELARVDAVEAEAWAAWERSQRPAEVTTTERADGKGRAGAKAVLRRENRDGSAEWLRLVVQCVEKRQELLAAVGAAWAAGGGDDGPARAYLPDNGRGGGPRVEGRGGGDVPAAGGAAGAVPGEPG